MYFARRPIGRITRLARPSVRPSVRTYVCLSVCLVSWYGLIALGQKHAENPKLLWTFVGEGVNVLLILVQKGKGQGHRTSTTLRKWRIVHLIRACAVIQFTVNAWDARQLDGWPLIMPALSCILSFFLSLLMLLVYFVFLFCFCSNNTARLWLATVQRLWRRRDVIVSRLEKHRFRI